MFGFKVGRRWVSTCGDFARRLTVPGGADVPTAAVTVVTVHPPYRRRGLLTAMMKHQLEQVAERGEPLAALWASESLIYGRYGYGPATTRAVLSGTNRRLRLPARVSPPRARSDEVTREEFLAVAPGLHESMRPDRPGTMVRDKSVWEFAVFDKEFARRGVLRDPLRPALRRGRRRRRVRDVPLQGEVRRGARGRGQGQGGLGRGPRGVRHPVALPARPRPGAHLQLVERPARRAAAPPGHRRPSSRHVGHRQPLRARRRRRGGALGPVVRRRRRPGHRGRRPDPAREHRPLPGRHRRRPGGIQRPR